LDPYKIPSISSAIACQLPADLQVLQEQPQLDFNFKQSPSSFFWMQQPSIPLDDQMKKVTNKLIEAHKAGRFEIFHTFARTKGRLRTSAFFKRYRGPTRTIGTVFLWLWHLKFKLTFHFSQVQLENDILSLPNLQQGRKSTHSMRQNIEIRRVRTKI
jgi:hypothetical protein